MVFKSVKSFLQQEILCIVSVTTIGCNGKYCRNGITFDSEGSKKMQRDGVSLENKLAKYFSGVVQMKYCPERKTLFFFLIVVS